MKFYRLTGKYSIMSIRGTKNFPYRLCYVQHRLGLCWPSQLWTRKNENGQSNRHAHPRCSSSH